MTSLFPHVSRALSVCLPVALLQCARAPSADEIARRGFPAAPASANASGSAAQGVPTGTRGWTLGQEYPYHLELSSTVTFGDQSNVMDFDLNGDLLVIPASVADGITTLFVAVRNAKLVSRVPDAQGQLSKIADQASATGCLLTLTNGRVSEIRIASDLSPLTVGIYRELGSRLQFANSDDGADKYESEEYDGTGKYVAKYTREDAAGTHFQKRKLRYTEVLGAKTQTALGPSKVLPYVSVSEGELTLSAEGRPTEVKAHDEISITGAQTPVHTKNTVLLRGGSAVPGEQRDFATIAAHLTHVAADEPYSGKPDVAALDSARIRGLTYDTIVAQLKAFALAHPDVVAGGTRSPADATRNQPYVHELSNLFVALAAIFRQHPDTVARAATAIRTRSPIAAILLDALGSSGTAAAHQALVDASRAPKLDSKLQKRALLALIRTSSPSDVSVAALKSRLVGKPFDDVALFGLGTYARHFRDAGSTQQAGEIATLLDDTLKRAGKDVQNVEMVLGAIMNCGCGQILPEVTPFLTDQTEGVRVQAVRALQSMLEPKVDSLIAARMVGDTASTVRIAAIEAASVRPDPSELLLQALGRASTTDADAHVRYKSVDLMIQWLPKRRDLRTTLEAVAKNDSEPQVRSRAQAAL